MVRRDLLGAEKTENGFVAERFGLAGDQTALVTVVLFSGLGESRGHECSGRRTGRCARKSTT